MKIDINCDMGEGMLNDADIMLYISSANIACGYHAGDEKTMRNTIDLCLKHNVAIGAHPGFDDKANFGRKPILLSADELYQLVWKQLEIIQAICNEKQAALHHVKLHGALYNMAAKDKSISNITAQAVKDFNPELIFYGLSGSVMISEAKALGLKTANEVFADRTYQPDGTLTPRTQPHALIKQSTEVIRQVEQIVKEKRVTTLTGEIIPIKADTICIHGDGDHALEFAIHIHKSLQSMGYIISAGSL
ncbi:MAG: 5-oxoprolinase subunit PxpA [Cyclobacteriaceae bacterium]|nr:MAG: 5-oxoprolinase subunit PxpA [Cyclobacteriaceae bacterium]